MRRRAWGLTVTVGVLVFVVLGCRPTGDEQADRCDEARNIYEELSRDYATALVDVEETASELRELHPSRGDPDGVEEWRRRMGALGNVVLRVDTLVEQNHECFTAQERLDARVLGEEYREWRDRQG